MWNIRHTSRFPLRLSYVMTSHILEVCLRFSVPKRQSVGNENKKPNQEKLQEADTVKGKRSRIRREDKVEIGGNEGEEINIT